MMYVRIMCVLVLWARLTTVHRAYMLTHSVLTNTTCEEKTPQVHRRIKPGASRSSNSAAGKPAAGQKTSVGVRGDRQSSTRVHTRALCRESDFGSRMQVCRATSGRRSWRLGIRISWPAACPPQIRVFVVCLCSLSDEVNSSHLGMLTAIGTLSNHRAYLGVGGILLLVMECSSMRAGDGYLSRDGGICRSVWFIYLQRLSFVY